MSRIIVDLHIILVANIYSNSYAYCLCYHIYRDCPYKYLFEPPIFIPSGPKFMGIFVSFLLLDEKLLLIEFR